MHFRIAHRPSPDQKYVFALMRAGWAVYWLAATLVQSAARGLAKVSKKQLLDCAIVKACENLIEPEEPLVRLYANQCHHSEHSLLQPLFSLRAELAVDEQFDGMSCASFQ